MIKNKVYNLSQKAKQYYFTKKLNHIIKFNVVFAIFQKYLSIIDHKANCDLNLNPKNVHNPLSATYMFLTC